MNKYINKITGAVLETDSRISAMNWELEEVGGEQILDYSKMKKEEIQELLIEKEIEFEPKDTKDVLIAKLK